MDAATSDGNPEQRGGEYASSGRDRHPAGVFVGRDRELNHGLAVIDDAAAGEGRLLLISGQPGIGKSRLADELARRARDRGFQVAWGRCWEAGGAPAYWPWVQSLRSLVRNLDPDEVRLRLADSAASAGQLLPELRRPRDETPTLSEDPEAARFQLFDSVTAVLKHAARTAPIMVVLDDLQVADTPSLLLLRFVTALIGEERILVVATYRDTDAALGGVLAETVDDLLRERVVSRITPRGIAEADVPRLIESVTGVSPHAALARLVHAETEGNPLFIEEVARVLLDEGALDAEPRAEPLRLTVPRSVRDVIARRLQPLPEACTRALQLASVLGREFSVEALAALAQTSVEEMLELLRRPREVRVVIEVPDSRGRLRFGHVLIRESLYDEIAEPKRRQLHRTALAVVERLYRGELDAHLSELAHHAFEGAGEGHWEQSIAYNRRAGDEALSLLAYEESMRLLRLALDSLEQSGESQPLLRCDLLLELGEAQARSGDETAAKASFLEAADLARDLDLADRVAKAALGYSGRLAWGRAGGDTQLVPLLEAGVAAVGTADSPLRARLLARLAGALRDAREREPRESFARAAVDIARRLDDRATLAYTLYGLFGATFRPDNPAERASFGDETVRLGEAARDREVQIWGHNTRLSSFFEMGDLRSVHDEIAITDRLADELRDPVLGWLGAVTGAVLALTEGRLDDAERIAEAARNAGPRSRSNDALAGYAGHMFQLRREQARLREVEGLVLRAAAELSWYPMFRCAVAAVHVDLGRQSQARTELNALASGDFEVINFDNCWIFNLSLLSEVAHALGDHAAAAVLYERLRPYALRTAFAWSEGCVGSTSRALGLLATLLARYDEAQRHFEDALEHNDRMGARTWLAHTKHDFAQMLLQRGTGDDQRRARELLADAALACDDIGLVALRAKVTLALGGQTLQHQIAAAPGSAVADRSALCLEGEYWAVTYESRTVRIRDSKGMRVIARLLEAPGRPQPSLDLERLGADADDPTARAAAASDAGEMLDAEARRAYRARIAELRLAIDDAKSAGAADRAGALEEELDFITRELSRGLGLGGRSRYAGSAAERARINVTRAVKAAMQRISDADSSLAAHLGATLRTGTVCVYAPDPRSPIEWTVTTRRT